MSVRVAFWLAAVGLVVTCVASTAARAAAGFSPRELKEISRRRKSRLRLARIIRRHDQVALAAETLQVVATAVFIGAGTFWIWTDLHLEGPPHWWAIACCLAGGALALLAVESWIPRAVARLWANPILYYGWPLWDALAVGLYPLVLGGRIVEAVCCRAAGRMAGPRDEESFEEDIRTFVEEGHREGLLEEDAQEMIKGVIELGEADVAEVMTPRTDMVCIPKGLSWEKMLAFVTEAGHTRIPVFDKTRDDIVGILYVKDLLPELAKPPAQPRRAWTELLREPYFVPKTKPIDALLQEFRETRNHMAVVLDEYGGVCGVVTMEDVLEQIVGEIVDEYDKEEEEEIREVGDGVFEVMGKAHLDQINDRLDIRLPEQADFDTIAGLILDRLGHIPRAGETVLFDNVRITVIQATRRRIERVQIELLEHPTEQEIA